MNIDRDDLRIMLEEILEDRSYIDQQLHAEEHEWIRAGIKAEQERKRMYRAMTRSFISWGLPALLTGALAWLQGVTWPKL